MILIDAATNREVTQRTVQVIIKNVYGTDKIYPANYTAEVLANIAKTKTLSLDNLRDAKLLGLKIEFQGMVMATPGSLHDQVLSLAA